MKLAYIIMLILSLVCVLATTTIADTWFESPTPANNYASELNGLEINASISTDNLHRVIFNNNGTNYTVWDDYLIFDFGFDNISDLGENDTNIVDYAEGTQIYGGDMNATNITDVQWIPDCKFGGCLNFTGTLPSYFRIPVEAYNFTEITVSAWIYKEAATNYGGILDYSPNNGFGIIMRTSSGGTFDFYVLASLDSCAAATVALNDTWTHLIGVYNGANVTIYKNGVQATSVVCSGSKANGFVFNESGNIRVGNDYQLTDISAFNGSIDEIKMYNKSIVDDDIAKMMYETAIFKTNSSQYYFYENKTNLSVGAYSYYIYSEDTSNNGNFTDEQVYNMLPQTMNISINYSFSINTIYDFFYGFNALYGVANNTWIVDNDLGGVILSDYQWIRNAIDNVGMNILRDEMNLQRTYLTLVNPDFEYWTNFSNFNVSYDGVTTLFYDLPYGWILETTGANGSLQLSTDAYRGIYSVNVTNNETGGGNTLFIETDKLFLDENMQYTISAWIKTRSEISLIVARWDNYSNICVNTTSASDGNWQYASCTFDIVDDLSVTQGYIIRLSADGNEEFLLDSANFSVNGSTWTKWNNRNASYGYHTSWNIMESVSHVQWAHDTNKKILFMAAYTPPYLYNGTSDCWSYPVRCYPSNATLFANHVVEFLDIVTQNGLYADDVMVEVWNEPDGSGFWLTDISSTDTIKSELYNDLYNETYKAVKVAYPSMLVGGLGSASPSSMLMTNFLGNLSDYIDFVSFHDYDWGNGQNLPSRLKQFTSGLRSNMTYYGVKTNMIFIDEFNDQNIQHQNESTPTYPRDIRQILSLSYLNILNLQPYNMSMQYFNLVPERATNQTSIGEYPQNWYMFEEPLLSDYDLRLPYKASANVTKAFAHLCPGGASVVNYTTTDDSAVSVLACKKDNMYSVVLINNLDWDVNATNLNLTENDIGINVSYLRDYETGTTYTLTDNVLDGIILTPQQVIFLFYTNQPSTITLSSPINNYDAGLYYLNTSTYTQNNCALTFTCTDDPSQCVGDDVNVTVRYEYHNETLKSGISPTTKLLLNLVLVFTALAIFTLVGIWVYNQYKDLL